MISAYQQVTKRLNDLESRAQLRTLNIPQGIDFSSNDFLSLCTDPRLAQAAGEAARNWGTGSGASRLVSAETPYYQKVEQQLATFVHQEEALLFSTGYMANVGVISSLADAGATFIVDRLCHASLYDGLKLGGSTFSRYIHCDMHDAEKKLSAATGDLKIICTESLFSMDGDRAPLIELSALAHKYNALLLVDEAHALGMYGSSGAGLAQACSMLNSIDIYIGTLGKAAGCGGGFVACRAVLKKLILNRARSFIYSTAPPPPQVGAILKSLEILPTLQDRAKEVHTKAQLLRSLLTCARASQSQSHIIPIRLGSEEHALHAEKTLQEKGFMVRAIRPPTVPPGTSRLRIVIHHHNSEHDIRLLANALNDILRVPS